MPNLPARPSIDHLKKQAKRLLGSVRANDPNSLAHVGPYFGDPAKIGLQQAQLVIARDYGFSSWTKLKRHIEAGAGSEETTEQLSNRFLDLACIHYAPDPNSRTGKEFEQAAALLAAHPEIARHCLHTAAAVGDVDAIRDLLARAPQSVDEKGGPFHWTPLMYAAYARLPGVSTFAAGATLLAAGADPNAHFMSFGTYRFAVLTGVFGDGEGGLVRQPPHPEMEKFARALLEAGANPNDSQGAYNRCFSPDNTHLELMLEYGLKDSNPSDWWLTEPDRKPAEHRTMHFQLIIALRWGFADRARLLIEHGVDINTPDSNYYPTYTEGYTPYQVALMRGLPEIANLIKARGGRADPLGGPEAFQAACMSGDFDAAYELGQIHMDQQPEAEREMLLEAASNGNLPAVQCMIKLGFELSPKGYRNPLHAAAFNGHLEVIHALIDAGADTAMRDPQYHTPPFVHAMHNFKNEAAEVLMDCPNDIFASAAMGRAEQVKSQLKKDPGLVHARFRSVRSGPEESFERDWVTPLWYATMNGQDEIVRLLLDHGADATIADEDGRTILNYAEEAGQDSVCELLASSVSRKHG